MEENKIGNTTADFFYTMILKDIERSKEESTKKNTAQINGFITEFRSSIHHTKSSIERLTKELNMAFDSINAITNRMNLHNVHTEIGNANAKILILKDRIDKLESSYSISFEEMKKEITSIGSVNIVLEAVRKDICYRLSTITKNGEKTALGELELPNRVMNCLERTGYKYIEEVVEAIDSGEILDVRKLGRWGLKHLSYAIEEWNKKK